MTDTVFPWTFDATFTDPNWKIDDAGATNPIAEIATHETLTLRFRVTTSVLESVFRPLKPNQQKVNILPQDDGGFVAIDRSNGNNTFTIGPPDRRKPLRQTGDFHVRRYEEQLISQEVGEWTVEIEFVRDADRTDTPSISETPATDEWGLTTRFGEIATGRVDADFLGTGADGVERYELTTRLTFAQAHTFEAALSLLSGTRVRAIPDAPNVIVDDTSGDANTLTIDAPDGQTVVADGDYVVTAWESERLTDAYQSVTLTIAQTT